MRNVVVIAMVKSCLCFCKQLCFIPCICDLKLLSGIALGLDKFTRDLAVNCYRANVDSQVLRWSIRGLSTLTDYGGFVGGEWEEIRVVSSLVDCEFVSLLL